MVWCLILAKILHDKVFTIFMSLECTRLGLLPRMSQILTCLSDDDVTRHPLIWLLRSKPARKSKALNVVCFVFFYTDWTKKVKTHRTLLHRAPSVWKQVYPSEHPNSKQSRHLCWPGEKKNNTLNVIVVNAKEQRHSVTHFVALTPVNHPPLKTQCVEKKPSVCTFLNSIGICRQSFWRDIKRQCSSSYQEVTGWEVVPNQSLHLTTEPPGSVAVLWAAAVVQNRRPRNEKLSVNHQ